MVLVAPADVLVLPNEADLFATISDRLPPDMAADYAAFRERYFDFANIFDHSEDDLIALNGEITRYYTAASEAAGTPLPQDLAYGRPGGWMSMAVFFSMGGKADFRPPLSQVAAPVLVIHGARDLQPEAGSRSYADALPNARFEVVDDASHFVFHDRPETIAELVGTFLTR